MAFLTPYADPNAHGSLDSYVTFRRNRKGTVLSKKIKTRSPNSTLQTVNINNFKTIVRGAKEYFQNQQSVFHPGQPKIQNPWWYRFIQKLYYDFFQTMLNIQPVRWEFQYYVHEDGTRHYTCDNFALVGWLGPGKAWEVIGGNIQGDPVTYPWQTEDTYHQSFFVIYSINASHPVTTTYKFRVKCLGLMGTTYMYFHFPRYKKINPTHFNIDWTGWLVWWQGQIELWCSKNIRGI